jgi:hypothetical protein
MRFPRISLAISFLGVLALLALVFEGCASPLSSGKTGSLSIGLSGNVSRTLVPGISMDAASYTVTGTGPGGATFTETSTGASVTKSGLAFGSWTIVVNALNASGTLIGSGTTAAEVITGETTTVNVTVKPIEGTGTLSLDVTWTASQVHTPSITASLTPALGSAQSLAFDVSSGSASFSSSSVGNGYYTLALTLNDNAIAVAGAVEVVRIVAGGTTSGSYAFPNVNAIGGAIQVNINTELQDPLLVNIAGGSASMSARSTETLTASAVNYGENVTYVWYVNGVSVATGASYTFGAASVAGYNYRIDVTAFSADGTRAGSATQNVHVVGGSDGSTWTVRALPSSSTWTSVAYGNGRFVAVGYHSVAATSPDGINWTATSLPGDRYWSSVTYGNGTFVAVSFGNIAATSTDGVTWVERGLSDIHNWYSVTYGNGVFVAVATYSDVTATSPDGVAWTTGTLPASTDLTAVTYGNGVFVAVAYGNLTAISPDGLTWTNGTLPANASWPAVTYGNGVFVAVDGDNYAATSTDGINWTLNLLPRNGRWDAVTYGNGIFVALCMGSGNIVATSTDGINWVARTLSSFGEWCSVTYGNGVFVAIAQDSNLAATSP